MYVNEFFALNANYIRKLHDHKPKFGYDGFGEIVFFRTYSRVKPDGGQESWHDVVIRVINGTMSIRKDWYLKNFIKWDEDYWQKYAYNMALAMFRMQWLPAGRGMWAMGTNFVFERGSMALNNCFSGDTKFVANQGIRTLKELVGTTVGVKTNDGQKRAEVKSFGEQVLYNVVFKPHYGRSKHRLTYQATREHRWILSNGQQTTGLQPGDCVTITPGKITNDSSDYNEGFVHGLLFADGCNFYKNNYYIQLCGWKEKYRDLLEQSRYYSHTIKTENRMIFTSDVALKAFPETEQNQYYKQGFFEAWRLMDGHYKKRTYCIDSIHPDAYQWLSDHSGFLNYVVVGHSIENNPTNYGERSAPLHRIKVSSEPVEFIVDSVTYSGRKEEVYCVTEPETQSFMLAGGIVTGNCGYTVLGNGDRLGNDLHWMMDALMLGVGVGFDPIRDDLKLYRPIGTYHHYVKDSREGWADSERLLVNAFTQPGQRMPMFKYDHVRGPNLPIRGFGGLSSGPDPLKRLHDKTQEIFELALRGGTAYDDPVRLKTDLGNLIGVCVVAGNVRRSAELCKGKVTDKVFMSLKDYEANPDREDWGYMSNNSVALYTDEDFESLGEVAKRVVTRGEPGIMNLRNFKAGRIGKPTPVRDDLATGLNPCGEIPLEDKELCNVVETLPTVCPNVETWYKSCEYASFYASTVSLLPTHREETNRVVMRNRRIGVSIIDWTGWVLTEGLHKVTRYMRKGYDIVTNTNRVRNAESGVPEAIRKTTIKPGGTGPKLPGRTPGIGYPTFAETLRRMRVAASNPICPVLDAAGVPFEPDYFDPLKTRVYEFPTKQGPAAPADQISLWEQAMNLVTVQREWSDNAVSNTLYFRPKWQLIRYREASLGQPFKLTPELEVPMISSQLLEEMQSISNLLERPLHLFNKVNVDWQDEQYKVSAKPNKYGTVEIKVYRYDPNHEEDQIERVLSSITPLIKSCSLLPHSAKGAYRQMPEEGITPEEYKRRLASIKPIDWTYFKGSDGLDEKFCSGPVCEIPSLTQLKKLEETL